MQVNKRPGSPSRGVPLCSSEIDPALSRCPHEGLILSRFCWSPKLLCWTFQLSSSITCPRQSQIKLCSTGFRMWLWTKRGLSVYLTSSKRRGDCYEPCGQERFAGLGGLSWRVAPAYVPRDPMIIIPQQLEHPEPPASPKHICSHLLDCEQ